MARSRSSKKPAPQRALSPSSTNLRLLRAPQRWQFSTPYTKPRVDLRLFEDRRVFHPNRFISPARSIGPRSDARLVVNDVKPQTSLLSAAVRFNEPRRGLICIRRNARKEVLHALGRVGAGSGRSKKRRNQFSDVSC